MDRINSEKAIATCRHKSQIWFILWLQEEINDTPLYANVKLVQQPNGSAAALEINYLTFYAHNGWYNVGYLGLWKVGAHDGDWEHLTVRLDAATGALQVSRFSRNLSDVKVDVGSGVMPWVPSRLMLGVI